MTQARNERLVPTRRISFEESLGALPRHFADGGDLVGSHLLAALSGLFPDGEEFFVRSVRRFRDRVTDPVLKKQVNGFIGQEAMHGREHRALNARLSELGYPTRLVEAATRRGLQLRERLLSDKSNLAATAALEHFTATLAEVVLTEESVRIHMGDPAVRDLFVWHALEESEHKAVAFDVYKAVGGSERTRVVTMKFLRFGFIAGLAVWVSLSVLSDPATYRPRRLLPSLRRLVKSPLVSRDLYRQLKDYDRPDFHPEDRDTTALVESWRRELFGPEGSLNDKLVSPTAA